MVLLKIFRKDNPRPILFTRVITSPEGSSKPS